MGKLFSWNLASIVIALMALFLTIHSASVDREYKELSIRPTLIREVETDDFHVAIMNSGLGPAEIRRIATKFGGACTFLESDRSGQFSQKMLPDILRSMGIYLYEPLAPQMQKTPWDAIHPRLYVRSLTPNVLLSVGQKIVLFALQKAELEAVENKLATLDTEAFNGVIKGFAEHAQQMPYYVEYCSLTGRFCEGADTIRQGCNTN